jgi:hypothetical protein
MRAAHRRSSACTATAAGRSSWKSRLSRSERSSRWASTWRSSPSPSTAAARPPAAGGRAPIFPSQGNIGRTNEGFGQAVWDLRSLAYWLRSDGAPAVGVAGMSLGGYTISLLATVEPSLSFVIPCIPLADITTAVVAHDRMRGIEIDPYLQDVSRRTLAIHSPLLRAPVVSGERVLVLAAEADRITGHAHAADLARHLRGSLRLVRGSHLFHVGRRETLDAIRSFVRRCTAPPRGPHNG